MGIKYIFGLMRAKSQFMFTFQRAIHEEMQLKYGLLKVGGCIIANNNSQIPKNELNSIMKTINLNFLYIVSEWKKVHGAEKTRFYC